MVMISYFGHYDTTLHNKIVITTKYDSYFVTKCDKSLFKTVSDFLLQNATVFLDNMSLQ